MTTDPPLVSVIMIFLDAERFIEEAIESVTSQTYQAWELVLVDDGSSDESSRIARRHADRSSGQIRYLEHEGHVNVGMSASRNAGIRAARGELIAFLDADDVYRPEKLERQVAILQRQPEAAMVYGATQHWYSWTGRSADLARDSLRRLGVAPDTLVHPPALIPLFLRLEAQTPGTCGILARRDAIERIGGFEDRFDGMFEDQVFLFKLCLSAPIFVEGGSWDRYRQHPDSFAARAQRRRGLQTRSQPAACGILGVAGGISHRARDLRLRSRGGGSPSDASVPPSARVSPVEADRRAPAVTPPPPDHDARHPFLGRGEAGASADGRQRLMFAHR